MKFLTAVIALMAVAVVPGASFAQAGSSAMADVVRDGTGGALPGAAVKVVNERKAR